MNTGMLWFDDSEITLKTKIERAAAYYFKKYGRTPDLAMVHPSLMEGANLEEISIAVRPYRPVLPGHVWIGIEDKE